MAIYHCHCKVISRGQGRSSVGASAYRSGERMTNDYDGITHDYTNKSGVVYSEVMLCENAPKEYENRSVLWNEVERIEKGSNARLAREYEVALPIELSREEQIQLVRDYVRENFVSKGMCADFAIHDKEDGNPHAHIMLTTRPIEQNGEWGAKQKKEYILDKNGNKQYDKKKKTYKCKTVKVNDWDTTDFLRRSRENWAAAVNRELEKKNLPQRIDHRTLSEQGKERIPTEHLGVAAKHMEKRGIQSDRGNRNREIKTANEKIKAINLTERQLKKELSFIREDMRWIKSHELTVKLEKQLQLTESKATLVDLQTRLEEIYKGAKKMKPTKATEGRTVTYDLREIPYFDYHQNKLIADVAELKDRVSQRLAILEEKQKAEQAPVQKSAYERLQEKQETITGKAKDSTAHQQTASPAVDVSETVRQLSAYRTAFVRATVQSGERTSYQENPIYRQQAAQIADLAKRVREQGESIKSLQEEKAGLGILKGKEKKALQEKINNFVKLRESNIKKLEALGVSDPAQAEQAIKEKKELAALEQEKVKVARENAGAAGRAEEAKAAFLALAKTVPPDQRQRVAAELAQAQQEQGEIAQGRLCAFQAETEARRQLDTALQPEQGKGQEQNRTQTRSRWDDRN